MLANLHHPEQSTTGDPRRGQDHWVAGRRAALPPVPHPDPARRAGAAHAGAGHLVVPDVPGGHAPRSTRRPAPASRAARSR